MQQKICFILTKSFNLSFPFPYHISHLCQGIRCQTGVVSYHSTWKSLVHIWPLPICFCSHLFLLWSVSLLLLLLFCNSYLFLSMFLSPSVRSYFFVPVLFVSVPILISVCLYPCLSLFLPFLICPCPNISLSLHQVSMETLQLCTDLELIKPYQFSDTNRHRETDIHG